MRSFIVREEILRLWEPCWRVLGAKAMDLVAGFPLNCQFLVEFLFKIC